MSVENYERAFHVVYGEDGGEQQRVPASPGDFDFPVYRARKMVMALLHNQIEKTEEGPEQEELREIRDYFKHAPLGDIVFGRVKKFTNKKGRTRFIGIVKKGGDYRTAGEVPKPQAPRKTTVFDPPRMPDQGRRRRHSVPPAAPRKPTDAERIADKMAKASRAAAEGDQ